MLTISKSKYEGFVYDISMKKNHNFFLDGLLVHNCAVWTGKKHYFMSVLDNEGVRYKEPYIKIMGMDAIKSSTPAPCREKLKESIKIILYKDNDGLIDFVTSFKEDFTKLEIQDISFPSGINGIDKYQNSSSIYNKGCPIHVRASLLHNYHFTKETPIVNGDKIKYVYLKMPNPINENIIAFIEYFPEDTGLEEYIDYDTMFAKSFIKPLMGQIDAMGWTTEKKVNLDQWF